ncbi:unnamed protein product [Phytophthora fragariaefolia]|uniref:Unnamed protein product n=1 Tax=Phytophthora fragariaefolia TaxID=1490495 RepID=A0A9W6XWI4_9STRA|nr:unnamed protein product [Phytophthora fragariaefolia]
MLLAPTRCPFSSSVNPWIAKKPNDSLYTATNKTWMTTDTFQAWLRDVDSSMRAQQCHILILVDNASSHCQDGITLTNVCVARLPANTTSKLQPLIKELYIVLNAMFYEKEWSSLWMPLMKAWKSLQSLRAQGD